MGAAAAGLVAGLLVGVDMVPGSRAGAGTLGSWRVYATTGVSEVELSVDNLSGTPSTVVTGRAPIVTATALNATSTLGIGTLTDDAANFQGAVIFNVPGNTTYGTISGPAFTGYAADPADPSSMFALDSSTNVYALKLAAGNQTAPAPLATIQAPGTTVSCTSMAVTPDGSHLVVGCNGPDGFLAEVTTSNGAITRWSLPGVVARTTIEDVAISPSGLTAYVVSQSLGTNAPVSDVLAAPLPLVPGTTSWPPESTKPISQVKAVTVSPSGSTLYVGGLAGATSTVETYNAASGGFGQSASVPSGAPGNGLTAIALTPDGRTLFASVQYPNAAGAVSDELCTVATTGGVAPASTCAALGTSTPTGPEDVAVTPDQAPVAGLTSVSGTAGSPVNFDASASTVTYGTITNYAWDFGDGSSANTPGPTVSHTFGAATTYAVTVVETDSGGTSIPPATPALGAVNGPGTTAYRNASLSARTSESVPISKQGTPPPPPPTTTTTTVKKLGPTTTTSTTLPGTPTITLVPTIGPPGTIVNVTGQGFPPNRNVTVSWSTNTGSYTEMTDAHGNLPSHVFFILTPDILGPRQAVATTSGVPPAKANFLVVIRTSEPGGSLGVAFFRSEGE